MESREGDQTVQAKLWNIINGFADSLVLRCAVEVGIADIIHNHGGKITLTELATQLPVDSVNVSHLYRMMRYLVHMKLFTVEVANVEVQYALAPAAKYLIRSSHKCMVPCLLMLTDKDFIAPWYHLKDGLVQGGPTAFEKALGSNLWDYMADHPEKNTLLNEGMAGDTGLLTEALIGECKEMFDGIKSLVDVGGGTGAALRAIAKAFPHLKCTVFYFPPVMADSPNYPGIARVEGDMIKSIPRADAILMKGILHGWDDEECIRILKRCKEAVPQEGGKVIIVDIVLDVESTHPYSNMRLCMDLDMMLNTGGKERSEEEWKKLINDAGFRGCRIKRISAVQSVIEAYPQ